MMADGQLAAWVGQTMLVLGLSGVAFIVLKTLRYSGRSRF
jgi:hypothetical protein